MKEKLLFKSTYYMLIIAMVAFTFSCKKKTPEPDQKTIQLGKLSASWSLTQVMNDNLDVTDQYTGFTLTIDQLTYTTQQGGNPWPSSGTYDFKGDDLSVLVRNDGAELTIDELTSSTLILSFNYTSLSGGRTAGVTGDFTFSLTK